MAIVNRDLDASEQKDVVSKQLGAVATSTTLFLYSPPYPCVLQSVRAVATGVSNAMQLAIQNNRFIVGTGATAIAMGISNIVLQNVGTSGVLGYSGLQAQGSSFLQLQAGDVIQVVSSVANGNATDLLLELVIKKTQDIVSMFGVST